MNDVAADRDGTDEKPSGPRSRKGVDTRARLVAAAKSVFEDHGFLDARISDISQRAGLSHGSFYHYFESKEAVFLEVAQAQGERFSEDSLVRQGLVDAASDTNVAERLRASVRRYLEMYRNEARLMGVIEQVSRYHGPVREVRAAQQRPYIDEAERNFRAGRTH